MFRDKIVVIAGAGGQVGYALSKNLSKHNAIVIGLVRSNLESNKEKIKKLSKKNDVLLTSITDTNSIKDALEIINQKFGKIDILINAAGYTNNIDFGKIETISDDMLNTIVSINLEGPFKLIRESIQLLNKSDNPIIVNISSASSIRASRSNPIYAASKAGLNLLTKTLALHLSPKIKIFGIAPSYLETPVSGVIKKSTFNDYIANQIPLKRVGTGDDVAKMVVSILSSSDWFTGQTIILDGGYTL